MWRGSLLFLFHHCAEVQLYRANNADAEQKIWQSEDVFTFRKSVCWCVSGPKLHSASLSPRHRHKLQLAPPIMWRGFRRHSPPLGLKDPA